MIMSDLPALESSDLYTVGWISALPLELAAASAMLDEQHGVPANFTRSPFDRNNYTYGRIGEHNLVIALLPAGLYGTTPAATTASQMLSSFGNIKIGLLVGIGAGIPKVEENDIRLGDIVVGQPDGRCGGVVQYDFRKDKADGSSERKGVLNSPPEVLLKAIAKIQALHEQRPSNVPQFLQQMLDRNPHMAVPRPGKPGFSHPGAKYDKLFEAEYVHKTGAKCANCDPAKEIIREARPSQDRKSN
jgi:hypothetical protein